MRISLVMPVARGFRYNAVPASSSPPKQLGSDGAEGERDRVVSLDLCERAVVVEQPAVDFGHQHAAEPTERFGNMSGTVANRLADQV